MQASWQRVALAVAFTAVIIIARQHRSGRGVGPAKDGKGSIPALAVEEGDGLELTAETELRPGSRRLKLRAGEGEVVLVLQDVRTRDENGLGFGRATLEPTDRMRGAKLVEEIARWLGQPSGAPADPPGDLAPTPLSYAALGTEGGWEANKLFLDNGRRQAEVFLNISADGRRARLVEKDDGYRKDLILLLARALRDGAVSRKTPAQDPRFAAADPLVREVHSVAGADGVGAGVWIAGGYLSAARAGEGKPRDVLRHWRDLGSPPREAGMVDGRVHQIVAAPTGGQAAVLVVHPQSSVGVSTEDPADVAIVRLDAGGPPRTVVAAALDFKLSMMTAITWSPDGTKLAVSGKTAGKGPAAKNITRVVDAASGKVVAATDPALNVSPRWWSSGGLLVEKVGFDESFKATHTIYRWQPGAAAPVPVAGRAEIRSPDEKYGVTLADGSLEVNGPDGHAEPIEMRREDEREALGLLGENGATWLGGHGLLLELEELVALDLATRKLRYVLPPGHLRFESASPDGRRLLGRDANDRLVWGAVD